MKDVFKRMASIFSNRKSGRKRQGRTGYAKIYGIVIINEFGDCPSFGEDPLSSFPDTGFTDEDAYAATALQSPMQVRRPLSFKSMVNS